MVSLMLPTCGQSGWTHPEPLLLQQGLWGRDQRGLRPSLSSTSQSSGQVRHGLSLKTSRAKDTLEIKSSK